MPFIDVADEKIFYSLNASDQDRVIVTIHGSGGDHTNWPDNLRNLPETNVYALDLPGHGQSSGDGHDSVEAYADFIEAFVTTLALENVTLIGHSLGGAIVQLLAVRAPSWLTGIVLVGTGARLRVHPDILEGLLSNFEATIDIVCQWAFGPTASEMLINAGREAMLNTPPKVIHGDYNACNQFDIIEKVDEINLPALVISGTADKLTPVKYGDYLCNQIPGAQHITIKDGGHYMALEKPEEFTEIISDFLSMPAASG
ncbi:MAG: alpha/beta fold hydrolase [Planctomycetota bacterium]|jgi:pimeloyl-ACP methyl ester carboxylesterase